MNRHLPVFLVLLLISVGLLLWQGKPLTPDVIAEESSRATLSAPSTPETKKNSATVNFQKGAPSKPLPPTTQAPIAPHKEGEFIVTLAEGVSEDRLQEILSEAHLQIAKTFFLGPKAKAKKILHLIATESGRLTTADQLAAYTEFEGVELNYVMEAFQTSTPVTPNDPDFPKQWALNQVSSVVSNDDVDIDAPEAWAITPSNTEVVVAIIDTGIDYTHLDLIDRLWVNPLEAEGDANGDGYPGIKGVDDDADGLVDEDSKGQEPHWSAQGMQFNPLYRNDLSSDDDENGYEDDIYGIDTGNHDSDPMDINNSLDVSGHGTHVAGIIAASHNQIGTAGVSVKARIMVIKGFDSLYGQLTSTSELQALQYIGAMKERGVNVVAINASYGGTTFSPTQKGAIADIIAKGIIFVAAAGNGGTNNDSRAIYPASHQLENLFSVASTNTNDTLDTFSNYGLTSVHLAAPGRGILSTHLTTADDKAKLLYRSGTSMATAHVTGAIAVLAAVYPYESTAQLWQRIMGGIDPVTALAYKTISGGRLNLFNALAASQTCVGDTRGDADIDGLDLADHILGGTVFSLAEMAAAFGNQCQ